MSTSRICHVLLLLYVVCPTAESSAQEASTTPLDSVAEAQRSFVEGQQAAIAGRSADAARSFRRSLTLVPRASTAYNLAFTYRGEGALVEARGVLNLALAGSFGELGDYSSLFSQLLVEVERSIARIRLSVELEDARPGDERWLEVAGDRFAAAPGGQVRLLNPGELVVRAGATRHISRTVRLEMAPGETRTLTLHLRLERTPGTLVVRTQDAGAHIAVAGVGFGRGVFRRDLQPGFYDIEITSQGGTMHRRVELLAGRRLQLEIDRPGRVSGWLIAGLVLAAIVIGTGVAVGVVAATQEPEPIRDPFWGATEALSFSHR